MILLKLEPFCFMHNREKYYFSLKYLSKLWLQAELEKQQTPASEQKVSAATSQSPASEQKVSAATSNHDTQVLVPAYQCTSQSSATASSGPRAETKEDSGEASSARYQKCSKKSSTRVKQSRKTRRDSSKTSNSFEFADERNVADDAGIYDNVAGVAGDAGGDSASFAVIQQRYCTV
jgi:hypothetical protein